ncbi:unnamed protein product, partial [Closterium sp. Naga37s-1]
VSQLFGFEEVDYPVLESEELFVRKAGEEITQQLYNFEDKGGRRMALRPELTPSLARLVLQKGKSLPLPVKWFAIGQCWRYERMTRGRRREHYQWNMDILGVPGVEAEAELLAAVVAFFTRVGLSSKDVGIRVSNRKVLQEVVEGSGVPSDKFAAVCVVVDKRDKIGEGAVGKELAELGVEEAAARAILATMNISSLSQLREHMAASGGQEGGSAAVADLERLFSLAEAHGFAEWLEFDASVVRGLAYYTGTVFEAFDRAGELRAICGGGRYDRLLSTFGAASDTPACGFGFGDAVIVELLKQRGLLPSLQQTVDDIVVPLDQSLNGAAASVAARLRQKGRRVDLVLENKRLKCSFGGSEVGLRLLDSARGRGGCEGEVTKARVAAVETVASNAGGLTKRSVAGSNGNAAKQFTMDEVFKHNRPGDAWVVVQNKVYDVSDFADRHPGGRVIYSLAGRNATDVFAAFHKPSTKAFLATLQIGELKESEVEPTGDLLKDFRDLRSSFEAKGYFKSNPAYYLFKVLSTFAIVAASIAIIMWTSDPRWVLFSGMLLGLYWQQVGWLSHDFLHHQVFQSRFWNTFIGGYIHGNLAMGFSTNWWKNKHNTHHAVPNECDKEYRPIDPDIDTLPYLAWSEDILATVKSKTVRSLLRYQSPLFFPILSFARFAWSYASLTYCFSDEVPEKERFWERLFMVLHYAWVLGFGFGCLPFWTGLMWMLTGQICGGLFLAVVFVQSHNAMEIYNEGKDFYTAQIVTTRDVNGGLFNDWFTGGLNRQLEHHLFPTMPRHHLGKTCKAVKELCEKHGLVYEDVSFAKGTSLVLEHLSRIAEKA